MVRISLGLLASLSLAASVSARYCGPFTSCTANCDDGVSQCDFSYQVCLNDNFGGCVDIVTVTYTNSICDYSTTTIDDTSTTTEISLALIVQSPSIDFEETAFVTNTVAGSTSTEVVTETEYTTETITPQAQGGAHRLAKRVTTPTYTITYDYTVSCTFELYLTGIFTEIIETTEYSGGGTIYGTTETVYSTVEVTADVEIVTNTQTDTVTVQTTLVAAPSSTAEGPSSTTEAPTSTAPAESSSQPADTTTEEPAESSAPSNEPISSTLAVGTSTGGGATQASSLPGTTTGTLATTTVPPASSAPSSASVSLFTGGVPRLAGYGGTFWLLLLGWL